MITRGDLAYPGFVMSGLSTVFEDTFYGLQDQTLWDKIAVRSGTNAPIVKYPFLGASPHFKKFRDRMDDQGINPYLVTIEDEEWEENIRIAAKAIEDDATGMYRMRAEGLAEAAAWFDDEQSFSLLDRGFTGIGYDGQAFFSASHSSGTSGTQSNLTTNPLSATALQAAVGAGGTILDDTGRPYRTRYNTLVVGPLLEMRARELIGSPVVVVKVGDGSVGTGATAATGYSNVLNGYFDLIVSPWITGYHWVLVDGKRKVKPVIIQDREDVPLQTWNDTDDPAARRRREYTFTAFMRRGFGYGPWQLAYGGNATA